MLKSLFRYFSVRKCENVYVCACVAIYPPKVVFSGRVTMYRKRRLESELFKPGEFGPDDVKLIETRDGLDVCFVLLLTFFILNFSIVSSFHVVVVFFYPELRRIFSSMC